MRLRLTPEAEADIDDIFAWGAVQFGLTQADSYHAALRETLEMLGDQPLLGREHAMINPPVRLHRFRAHHILYAIRDNQLLVLRILHGSANWIDHL